MAYAQDGGCSDSSSSSGACSSPQEPVSHEVPVYPMRVFRVGVDMHLGTGGIGSEATVPITRKFHLRAGSDFFSYSTVVNSDGNAVHADIQLRSAQAAVDWYPTHHTFRVSPMLVFANSTHGGTSVTLGQGQSITLNNETYYSSPADPLHGSATVDLRRLSPGVTIGIGHTIPRVGHHVSFPFEAGFYYAGTPGYTVQFAGTACDPRVTGAPACESVQNDPSFQYNLAQFKAKYQQYVNYARFFPVISSGVAFAF